MIVNGDASDACPFRRLETLQETTGRFRLNAELPIAFDGWGKMEVDLLDEETRLVIELDGGQPFANEDAYRRDRRKDILLQEHEQSYSVLFRRLYSSSNSASHSLQDSHEL
jgi:very-short-patch-repair endonuclease